MCCPGRALALLLLPVVAGGCSAAALPLGPRGRTVVLGNRLGAPIMTARIPLERISERLALYDEGLVEGGFDAATRGRIPWMRICSTCPNGSRVSRVAMSRYS